MAEGPLEGRRIAVTRPRAQGTQLAEALERLGAEVVVVPLVAIEPMDDPRDLDAALEALAGYDWIVFTSANGVDAVRRRLADPGVLRNARIAAVGPGTAAALRSLEAEPAFVPERHAGEEIAQGLEPLDGVKVLLPQADIADPRVADELRSKGAVVDAIAAYRTVPVEPSPADTSALRSADAVILASGSAARSLAAVNGLRDPTLLVCIGPKTAEAAREIGLPVGLVADEASAEGIIQALAAHFGKSTT